ncbi:MAG: TA system VapC family ribonuclease toxin [Acidobacteriaceae bacterium]
MSAFSTSLVFPDINVWLALNASRHAHASVAEKWLLSLPPNSNLAFCRLTQLGLLRLLTTQAIMQSDVLTQRQAWKIYDGWFRNGWAVFLREPAMMEREFRGLTQRATASPKDWADSYLAAFSSGAGVRLVTFDRVLSERANGAVLLKV